MADKILVCDFGSQTNRLIARRIIEMGVKCELIDHENIASHLEDSDVKGIIFSGGPHSVYEKGAMMIDPVVYESGLPILGICYGMQMMTFQQGGVVKAGHSKEYGKTAMTLIESSRLTQGMSLGTQVWMSHGDHVSVLAPGFKAKAYSYNTPFALIEHETKPWYGVQFHPEVTHTLEGLVLLKNFVFEIAKVSQLWRAQDFIEEEVARIRDEVKDKKVLCALSGGVDSSVTATLLHKAIGDQCTFMFIDHGCMRHEEGAWIKKTFIDERGFNLVMINAKKRFFDALKGVIEPEQKRKVIGNMFIRVFEEESAKLGDFAFLAQGTLYTDVIESGTKTAQTIKSHHNVGGLPEDMKFKVIEPLKTLFKDEARQVGLELGLPYELVYRQPFPGPGLSIRVMGEVNEESVRIVRESDRIFKEELIAFDLYDKIWQSFSVNTNVRSVGVMGDQRTYGVMVSLRAITSLDGMSADVAHIPMDCLLQVSNRIVNEVAGVNRVTYDITSKPPATIEWE
ncbi:MAG: glutamine-hydrolyzing GMP synthase [Erysipelothrix sp.]|nr:glutamine-hydrolyzing GMP synthase [Erysipelothrix sp.]